MGRRACADVYDIEMPEVTKRVLEESKEGLSFWMNYNDPSPIVDASELVVPVVSRQEGTKRIFAVLRERETWLEQQGLDFSTVMDFHQYHRHQQRAECGTAHALWREASARQQ